MKNYKTAAVRLLAAFLLLALLCGCGKKKADAEPTVFTVAVTEEPDTLNPITSEGGLAEEFFLLCYDPLWRIDESGQPVECLVDSYSLSSDELTWTIRLRQDVTFSDGVPLTASDVKFSYELASQYSTLYKEYFDGISAIRCPDDYTIIITTDYIRADLPWNPTPILPEHIWGDYEFSPSSFDNAEMVGTGPFLYSGAVDDSENSGWSFAAREDYFGTGAQIDEVFFSSCAGTTAAARAVSSGEADAAYGLGDAQLTMLQGVPDVELIRSASSAAQVWGLAYNTQSEFFEDAEMRTLVDSCIDRAQIVSLAAGGAAVEGTGFVPSGSDHFAQITARTQITAAELKNRLLSAGYVDSDEDGILEDARGTVLSLVLYTSNLDEWAPTAASVIVEALTEAGIDVVQRTTDGDITSACKAGGEWDLCLYARNGSADAQLEARLFMDDMVTMTGWEDASAQSELQTLINAADTESANSASRQLQQLVYDGCPVSIIAYKDDIQAIRSGEWGGCQTALENMGILFGGGSAAVYLLVTSEAVG